MNDLPIFLAKLSTSQLIVFGGIGALFLIAWSYSYWRAAVKLALVVALLEGAIRKWILPQGQELVYFLKDIFLIGAYIKFYFSPSPEQRAYSLKIPTGIVAMLSAVTCASALNPNIGSFVIALYGIKIYFMYVPLIFMMPYLYRTEEQMLKELTWYTLLAIPICLLGFLQWKSDAFSVWNTYAQGEQSDTGATGFGLDTGRVRITGTFSYITGHTTFVTIFGALSLALLSLKEAKYKKILLFVALPLLAANGLMGGSRASIICLVFVAGGLMLASLAGRVGSNKQFIGMLVVSSLIAGAASIFVFKDAWMNWYGRFDASGSTADIQVRTVGHAAYALSEGLKQGGGFGTGMGLSHPASDALRRRLDIDPPRNKGLVYDNEFGQVMGELGIAGFLAWYTLRLIGILACWRSYRTAPPGLVRVLSLVTVLITVPYLFMAIVLNHTANILISAMTGLCLLPFLQRNATTNQARGSRVGAPVYK